MQLSWSHTAGMPPLPLPLYTSGDWLGALEEWEPQLANAANIITSESSIPLIGIVLPAFRTIKAVDPICLHHHEYRGIQECLSHARKVIPIPNRHQH